MVVVYVIQVKTMCTTILITIFGARILKRALLGPKYLICLLETGLEFVCLDS